jgi:chromosome segregation ATPase
VDNEVLEFLKEFKLEVNKKFEAMDEKLEAMDDKFEQRFTNLETQIAENTQILKALEHEPEVNKAEHDKLQNDIIHIQSDLARVIEVVDFIKKDLSRVEKETANNWADIARLKAVK